MPALISVGLSLQNAKISFLQIFCYQLTAFSHYAHGVEKQNRWIFSFAKCRKPHDHSPPTSVMAVSFR